jgi:hypothetical protein
MLKRGDSATIDTTITVTSGSLNNGIVDLEVYNNANWLKVGQQFVTGQNLAAGQLATYRYIWPVPTAPGQYTVMVGVFGANWTPKYYWDPSAAQFRVR